MTITLFPAPSRNGAYRSRVSMHDRAMTISVDYANKKWLPFCLFGETIHTKQFSLDQAGVDQPLSVDNTPDGLMIAYGPVAEAGQSSAMLFSSAWDISFRAQTHRKIISALHGAPLKKGSTAKGLKIAAALFIGFVLFNAFNGASTTPATVVSHVDPQVAAQAQAKLEALAKKGIGNTPTASATAAMQEALRQTMSEIVSSSAKIAQENAQREGPIKLTREIMASSSAAFQYKQGAANGKQIVVWSDPFCPHCQNFDNNILPKLPESVGVTILPVSFQPGSRTYAGHVLCGSTLQEKVARWKDLMQPEPKMEAAANCEKGVQETDRNSTLFVRSGMTVTPTITSIDGQQVFAGKLDDVADITNWVNGLK